MRTQSELRDSDLIILKDANVRVSTKLQKPAQKTMLLTENRPSQSINLKINTGKSQRREKSIRNLNKTVQHKEQRKL